MTPPGTRPTLPHNAAKNQERQAELRAYIANCADLAVCNGRGIHKSIAEQTGGGAYQNHARHNRATRAQLLMTTATSTHTDVVGGSISATR